MSHFEKNKISLPLLLTLLLFIFVIGFNSCGKLAGLPGLNEELSQPNAPNNSHLLSGAESTGDPQLDAVFARFRVMSGGALSPGIDFQQIAHYLLSGRGSFLMDEGTRALIPPPNSCQQVPPERVREQINICVEALKNLKTTLATKVSDAQWAQLTLLAYSQNGNTPGTNTAASPATPPWQGVPDQAIADANMFLLLDIARAIARGDAWNTSNDLKDNAATNLPAELASHCRVGTATMDQLRACAIQIGKLVDDKTLTARELSNFYVRTRITLWSKQLGASNTNKAFQTTCGDPAEITEWTVGMLPEDAKGDPKAIAANINVALNNVLRECVVEGFGITGKASPGTLAVCMDAKARSETFSSGNMCQKAVAGAQSFSQCLSPNNIFSQFNFTVTNDRGDAGTFSLDLSGITAQKALEAGTTQAALATTMCERRVLGVVGLFQPGPAPDQMDYAIASRISNPGVYEIQICRDNFLSAVSNNCAPPAQGANPSPCFSSAVQARNECNATGGGTACAKRPDGTYPSGCIATFSICALVGTGQSGTTSIGNTTYTDQQLETICSATRRSPLTQAEKDELLRIMRETNAGCNLGAGAGYGENCVDNLRDLADICINSPNNENCRNGLPIITAPPSNGWCRPPDDPDNFMTLNVGGVYVQVPYSGNCQ